MYRNKCDTVTVGPLPWSEPMKAAISPHSVIELKPSLAMCHILCRRRPPPPNSTVSNRSNTYSLILILSGDIQLNPGHGHNSTAYLKQYVATAAICGIIKPAYPWQQYTSEISKKIMSYGYVANVTKKTLVSTFTYHSFEINRFDPLSTINSSAFSISSPSVDQIKSNQIYFATHIR